jgi:hypothetical protein
MEITELAANAVREAKEALRPLWGDAVDLFDTNELMCEYMYLRTEGVLDE